MEASQQLRVGLKVGTRSKQLIQLSPQLLQLINGEFHVVVSNLQFNFDVHVSISMSSFKSICPSSIAFIASSSVAKRRFCPPLS